MPARLPSILLMACTLLATTSCQRGPATVQHEWAHARRLAADVRIQFGKAVDASNRAVMAETDDESSALAREAEKDVGIVEREAGELGTLVQRLQFEAEVQSLASFKTQLAAYREVDRGMLELAVENSNLKAQRLSFGAAREAADSLEAALAPLGTAATTKDRCRVDGLVQTALSGVRQAQTLYGPHIAAADDASMTRIEAEIAILEGKSAAAVHELEALAAPGALAPAQAQLTQLRTLRAQIVALSRKNSNVRALDLALRVKPPLNAACDDTLRKLQDQLADEGSKATR